MSSDDPVLSRRSVRKYTAEPVTDAHVERLLRAAMAAPSAGNQQPWRFVVVRTRETLRALAGDNPYSQMLLEAALAVVVCGRPQGGKWPQFWDQDCAAATENLLIEAELLGLGAVWLSIHPQRERVEGVRSLLGIPDDVIPFAIVPIGWPAERKEPSQRYDAARVRYERW